MILNTLGYLPLSRNSDFYTKFLIRGGVEIFWHANNLSENIFPTKGICIQLSRTKEVGGYIRGVALMKNKIIQR